MTGMREEDQSNSNGVHFLFSCTCKDRCQMVLTYVYTYRYVHTFFFTFNIWASLENDSFLKPVPSGHLRYCNFWALWVCLRSQGGDAGLHTSTFKQGFLGSFMLDLWESDANKFCSNTCTSSWMMLFLIEKKRPHVCSMTHSFQLMLRWSRFNGHEYKKSWVVLERQI